MLEGFWLSWLSATSDPETKKESKTVCESQKVKMQGSMWWVVPRHVVAFLPSVAHRGPDQSDEAIHSERNWAKMLRKVEGVPGCGLPRPLK